ncbi:hypothetical protein AAKU52_003464 [Pedobacter sp. CG_S7]
MSESLRYEGIIWVPKIENEKREPYDISENERDYCLKRRYASFGT